LGTEQLEKHRRMSTNTVDEDEVDKKSSDDSFCTDSSGDSILNMLEDDELTENDKAI